MTDSSSKAVFADGYQAYGRDNGTPSGSETYKFTGKPYSTATGLYYDYQRWYDNSTGRFLSEDPVAGYLSDPQSQNGYVYARDLPTVLLDPTGANYECVDQYLCGGGTPPNGIDLGIGDNPAVCEQNPFICGGYSYEEDNTNLNVGKSGGSGSSSGGTTSPGELGSGGAIGSGEPGPTTVTVSEGNTPNSQVDTIQDLGGGSQSAETGISNPNGRLGDLNTQARTAEIKADIQARGLEPRTEFQFRSAKLGVNRFADVVAVMPGTNEPVEVYQIGVPTRAGFPVSREVNAIIDIDSIIEPQYGIFVRFISKFVPF